jgi:hypothetical protein
LNLFHNTIGYLGIYYLEDYFYSRNFLNLVSINLNGNSIGVEGCKFLANYLAKTKSEAALRHLYLSKNNIFSEGLTYLCEYFSIEKKSNLADIDLSDNYIETNGFIRCLESLIHDTNVEKLNLSFNDIDNIEALNRFFQFNISILQLDLSFNPFKKETLVKVLDELPFNMTLNRFIIDYNF